MSATHGWLGRGIARDDGQILVTRDGGATWTQQYRGKVSPELMQFADDENGWVAECVLSILSSAMDGHCEPTLAVTHDGGATWTTVTSYRGGGEIVAMAFLGAEDGWVLADPCQPSCGVAPAQLFRTGDGGATWTELPLPDTATRPLSMRRVDSHRAWVVTQDDILITRDGGATWTRVDNPCHLVQPGWGADFFGGPLDFVDAANGWTGCTSRNAGGGMAPKTLYRTLDGGLTWHLIASTQDPTVKNPPGVGDLDWGGGIADIHFFGPTTGWLVLDGPQSFLYHTDDGGLTWNPVDDGVGGGISHIAFTDPTHGWAWSLGVLLRTTDGGVHWQTVQLQP